LRFARVEPRKRARLFLLGLLAGSPRVNCWTIAEHAGETSPDGMQHLLSQAVWDADAVREICACMSWIIWVIPVRCWWSMRLAI
jgi:hypothetical protein